MLHIKANCAHHVLFMFFLVFNVGIISTILTRLYAFFGLDEILVRASSQALII